MRGYPAEELGLVPGDQIISVNGEVLAGWNSLSATLQKEALKGALRLEIDREGRRFYLNTTLPVDPTQGIPLLGVRPQVIAYPLHKALLKAFGYVWLLAAEIIRGLVLWIFGKTDVTMTGPVGIAGMAGDAVRQGFWAFISFLAVINLHLGILNLIPFPALDGGRIIFVFLEMVIGKKISTKWENAIHLVGFFVLIGLILFVTWTDLAGLLGKP
jgi:regulator of sigma E protease